MNAIEANALITKGARIDPRMGRASAEEQALLAEGWAELLEDVTIEAAEQALMVLLRRQTAGSPVILPADILAEVGTHHEEHYPRYDAEWLQVDAERRLAAIGSSLAEVEAHRGDRAWLAALDERLAAAKELEA